MIRKGNERGMKEILTTALSKDSARVLEEVTSSLILKRFKAACNGLKLSIDGFG